MHDAGSNKVKLVRCIPYLKYLTEVDHTNDTMIQFAGTI